MVRLLFLISIVLVSCSGANISNPLIGRWQVLRMQAPSLIETPYDASRSKDKYYTTFVNDTLLIQESDKKTVKRTYQIKGDTLKVFEQGKVLFKLRRDTLILSSAVNDNNDWNNFDAVWIKVKSR